MQWARYKKVAYARPIEECFPDADLQQIAHQDGLIPRGYCMRKKQVVGAPVRLPTIVIVIRSVRIDHDHPRS